MAVVRAVNMVLMVRLNQGGEGTGMGTKRRDWQMRE